MNAQAEKSGRRARKRPNETGGDAGEPQRDPGVAQMAAAEAEAGAADHQVQVAFAAYFIAEKRGFEPGHELDDWLAAEAEIAAGEQPCVVEPTQLIEAGVTS